MSNAFPNSCLRHFRATAASTNFCSSSDVDTRTRWKTTCLFALHFSLCILAGVGSFHWASLESDSIREAKNPSWGPLVACLKRSCPPEYRRFRIHSQNPEGSPLSKEREKRRRFRTRFSLVQIANGTFRLLRLHRAVPRWPELVQPTQTAHARGTTSYWSNRTATPHPRYMVRTLQNSAE